MSDKNKAKPVGEILLLIQIVHYFEVLNTLF